MLDRCDGGCGTGSQFLILRLAYISNMSLLLGLEPFQKFGVGGGWWWVGGWEGGWDGGWDEMEGN